MSDIPIPFPVDPQALDIQHDTDPGQDHGIARRVPHMGHAVLFFCLASFCVLVCMVVAYAVANIRTAEGILKHPILGLAAQGVGYLLTFALSTWIFPVLWERSFSEGVHWNGLVAKRRWVRVVMAGLVLSTGAQLALHFVPQPRNAPIDDMLNTAGAAWFTAVFGVLIAPVMEEMAFRGFLLPAIATAYDWITFPRTPAGLDRWQRTTGHTTPALVAAAMLSSIPFAWMHAAQLGYAWGVVGILYGVSLVLSWVRVRTQSLACSALMHSAYNFTIFALLFLSTDGFRHMDKIAH